MAERKSTKPQAMIYKTLHRKLRIERSEPHYTQREEILTWWKIM